MRRGGPQWQWNLSEIIDCLSDVTCLCVGRGLLGEVNHQIIEHAPGAGSTRVFAELQTHANARPPHHRVPVAPRCHILSTCINSVEFCNEGNGVLGERVHQYVYICMTYIQCVYTCTLPCMYTGRHMNVYDGSRPRHSNYRTR